jgi:hypothetical protein
MPETSLDDTTAAPAGSQNRSGGARTPALAAGLAALFLAGPAAVGPAGPAVADVTGSHLSLHDQFARSFTPERLLADPCGICSVKLPE